MLGENAARHPDGTILDRARLRYGWGYEKSDFALYGMDDGTVRDPTHYLGYHWFRYKVRTVLNSKWARSVTEDKWIFYRLADSFGLPTPETYGLYDPAFGTTWDLARPLRTPADLVDELYRRRPAGVVVKPNGGSQGQHLLALGTIDYDGGRATTLGGEETTIEEAVHGIDVAGDLGGYPGSVVQELVGNHPQIADLAPYATNTLRVQTLLSRSGEVHVLGAVLRLSRRGRSVDNYSQGGVAVRVDAGTGVTGRGITKKDPRFLTEHPDSGVPLEGRQVPFWDDVLDLVRRGAGCLTGVHGIGWDIAVTPTGPLVVEANNNWDLQLLQAHSDGYLADPEFRSWMAELGAPLPSGDLLRGLVGRRLWPVLARIRN
jgi:hypothetical protein